jgi:hypothetical protein
MSKKSIGAKIRGGIDMLQISGIQRKAKRAMPVNIRNAHQYCNNNKQNLAKSSQCGCFYCLEVFSPSEINTWIDTQKDTALCPYCGIDSVLPNNLDFVPDKGFLEEMHRSWF